MNCGHFMIPELGTMSDTQYMLSGRPALGLTLTSTGTCLDSQGRGPLEGNLVKSREKLLPKCHKYEFFRALVERAQWSSNLGVLTSVPTDPRGPPRNVERRLAGWGSGSPPRTTALTCPSLEYFELPYWMAAFSSLITRGTGNEAEGSASSRPTAGQWKNRK